MNEVSIILPVPIPIPRETQAQIPLWATLLSLAHQNSTSHPTQVTPAWDKLSLSLLFKFKPHTGLQPLRSCQSLVHEQGSWGTLPTCPSKSQAHLRFGSAPCAPVSCPSCLTPPLPDYLPWIPHAPCSKSSTLQAPCPLPGATNEVKDRGSPPASLLC